MIRDAVILLFVKAPVRGQVKSRLAAAIGQDHALNLYKNFVLDSIGMLQKTGYALYICFYPGSAAAFVRAEFGDGHRYVRQDGDDLGERMERAFCRAFSKGFTRAVLVGSDIPDLDNSVIADGVLALKTADVVLGPAADGGYYLIGFNRRSFLSRVFRGISWSTASVCAETVRELQAASRRLHVLPAREDVDTVADLKSLFERNRNTEFRSSRTMRYLEQFRRDILDRPGDVQAREKTDG